jgi:hypothetical protein
LPTLHAPSPTALPRGSDAEFPPASEKLARYVPARVIVLTVYPSLAILRLQLLTATVVGGPWRYVGGCWLGRDEIDDPAEITCPVCHKATLRGCAVPARNDMNSASDIKTIKISS